ncbi:GNAT family N-acetyltransferase [Candidatus Halobonum tyrrellensis]|uniref:Acetyltransferase, N-acetylglutamate synthase n=1 Tax=Candidatus Halobonum tyrrellensis G22 TaxID=1324957 RepID=V4HIV7_9EURY|nr:GNAT family N-acetyltransferase [Candidatus Halobonum tyrrellensis]ESP87834.1 acetyltransferase, N-acetylglutamate synthase [Candidatus Halobonum tyrrellensis G22]
MVTLRDATPADAEAVREVHAASIRGLGSAGYDAEQVTAWAGDPTAADYETTPDGAEFVVAEDAADGRVVGFGELRPHGGDYFQRVRAGPWTGEVRAVYVRPDAAREGVGSALLAELERRARERGLTALGLHAALNAVPFYEARGYERVVELPHEFGGDADGVTGSVVEMRKRLDA